MNNTAKHITDIKKKIEILNKYKKSSNGKYDSFTIDLSFGGNKHIDINRICIGSISDEEEAGIKFLELLINSLENSLKFWINTAQKEIVELSKVIND